MNLPDHPPARRRAAARRAFFRRTLLLLTLAALVLGGAALARSARDAQARLSTPQTPGASSAPSSSEPTPPAAEAPDDGTLPAGSDAQPWFLTLVNPWNPLPAEWNPTLTLLSDGQSVDARIAPALSRLMQDAEASGFPLKLASGYRTAEKQQSLLDERVTFYTEQGLSAEEACAEAARWVAQPGFSEHQLGLAADLNGAGEGPTGDDVYAWLADSAWRYGFILRYPADKTEQTGTAYEPWHFRYVGEEAAAAMRDSGQCLEEYLAE